MLKSLVVALAAANLGFFAWTQGWLDEVVGVPARGDSEPARLGRQVRPESVIILPPVGAGVSSPAAAPRPSDGATPGPPGSAGSTSSLARPVDGSAAGPSIDSNATATVAGAPTDERIGSVPVCLEAGPLTPAQFTAAVAALQAAQPPLPAGSWNDMRSEKPGVWMVYVGRFPNAEALQRKQDELRRLRGAVLEEVRDIPELSPGISLGRFSQRARAEEALEGWSQRGLRTARVVQAAAPVVTHTLRAARLPPELAAQYAALPLGAGARRFTPCATS